MKKLFVLGDSISLHYGPYLKQYLDGVVVYASRHEEGAEEEAFRNLDIPTGSNCGDSGMMLTLIRKLCAGGWKTDLLLLNCGLHDIKTTPETGVKQIPPENYRQNMRDIFTLLHGCAFPAIWVRTTPVVDRIHHERNKEFLRYGADVLEYNAIADELAHGAGLQVADLFGFTENLIPHFGSEGRFCDHVHFAEPVRALQAAFLAGAVRTALGS